MSSYIIAWIALHLNLCDFLQCGLYKPLIVHGLFCSAHMEQCTVTALLNALSCRRHNTACAVYESTLIHYNYYYEQ